MKKYIIFAIVMIAAAFLAVIVRGNSNLVLTELSVTDAKIPSSFNGFRIAQISDFHNADFSEMDEKVITLLREASPDIIVITGDYIDKRAPKPQISIELSKRIVDIAPTYYVTGNHEADFEEYISFKNALESIGIKMLSNESIKLKCGEGEIALCGINDPKFKAKDSKSKIKSIIKDSLALALPADDTYKILLAHRPDFFDDYSEHGANLVFSGHIHGGQVIIPYVGGILAPGNGLFPKYYRGKYSDGICSMIVSAGIGKSVIPLRINNDPEIVVVTLENE